MEAVVLVLVVGAAAVTAEAHLEQEKNHFILFLFKTLKNGLNFVEKYLAVGKQVQKNYFTQTPNIKLIDLA